MRPPARLRPLLLVAFVAAAASAGGASVGAVADTTPATPGPATPAPTVSPAPTTPGPRLELPAFGDLSYGRLAKMRGLDLPVGTSEAADIRVELVIPRSIARTLKVKVGRNQVRAVIARTTVTAEGAGDVIARPRFSKKIAKRLAAKPRHFKLGVRAIAGSTVVTGTVTIKTRD